MSTGEPGYVALYRSGELARRAERLEARLAACDICPRECGADRLRGEVGHCNSGCLPIVSSVGAHHGEEPVLSGGRGSGTIFFGNCNLRCVYCQNHQISQAPEMQRYYEVSTGTLAERMLYLQDGLHCHNINLVTPSHFVPQIVRAVLEAVPLGLRRPLVYNTSSYDSVRTLGELDGVIDIYLADLRYASNEMGRRYSRARHYVESSREAIKEMQRQVGDLVVDEEGIARRGLIIRHLILPNGIAGSEASLRWLVEEVSPEVAVSVMAQYYPAHLASKYHELDRKILPEEYREVAGLVAKLGIRNGWMQEMGSAEDYLPDFAREEPFAGRRRRRTR
ncbi:MAG TPA: radical SAM protein [Dehalococcoidales bacterium]|nr:MAG: radical SAM protein [Chloroflexi bacterium RBG_16_60_22]HJX12581.1 radical SAM protein [Dehalococcoidales bacterium]